MRMVLQLKKQTVNKCGIEFRQSSLTKNGFTTKQLGIVDPPINWTELRPAFVSLQASAFHGSQKPVANSSQELPLVFRSAAQSSTIAQQHATAQV